MPCFEVWDSVEAKVVGTIYRTYRNDPEMIPGRPAWMYLLASGENPNIESLTSAEDCRERVIEYHRSSSIPSQCNLMQEPPELVALYIALPATDAQEIKSAKVRVIEFLSGKFPSFTVTEATGVFNGAQESTLTVQIATHSPQQVADSAAALRMDLHQEGIGIGYRGHYHRVTQDSVPALNHNVRGSPE
jgi:hypothetical protein